MSEASRPALHRPLLRRSLQQGEQMLGVILRMPVEWVVEVAAAQGFDTVVIDCEHGPADALPLAAHLRVAAAEGMHAIVRVGSTGGPEVLRALDAGAAGILAPHIDSAEDARALVAAVRYAPAGARGLATYTAAGRHGTMRADELVERAEAGVAVLAMVESVAAVDAIEEIASTPGLDAIMIGPSDLVLDARHRGYTAEDATALVSRAEAAARRLAPTVGLVADADVAAAARAAGDDIVLVNAVAVVGAALGAFRQPDH